MTKTPVTKPAAAKASAFATLAALDSGEFLDETIPLLREVIVRQLKENRTKPVKMVTAAKRARDSATLSGLVRTLERLDALDKSRETRSKKTKTRSDAELKDRFVRRLDQLLVAEDKDGAAAKPQRGRGARAPK